MPGQIGGRTTEEFLEPGCNLGTLTSCLTHGFENLYAAASEGKRRESLVISQQRLAELFCTVKSACSYGCACSRRPMG